MWYSNKLTFRKKGVFFLIDAVLAMVMLVIGGFIIFGTFFIEPSVLQLDALAVSIVNYYGNTPISSIQHPTLTRMADCDTGYCAINDTSLTIAELLVSYYDMNTSSSKSWIRELVKNVTVTELPVATDLAVLIDGNIVYNTTDSSYSAKAIIPGKLIVIYFDKDHTLRGPTSLEILLW